MKPSLKYVRPDTEVSFYEMTEIVKTTTRSLWVIRRMKTAR